VDEFMIGAVLEEDGYEDWLKWASHKEWKNMHQFGGSMDKKVPSLFQFEDVINV
jgi:hypothetical protein